MTTQQEKRNNTSNLFTYIGALLLLIPFALHAAESSTSTKLESFLVDRQWPSLKSEIYPEPCQFPGIAIAANGMVLALNRGENGNGKNPMSSMRGDGLGLIQNPSVLVVDPKIGKIIGTWGTNTFKMPHQINVDSLGNVWIVDTALNKVFKFDSDGKPMLVVGGEHIGFRQPTDVAVLRDGSFVVSDGYGNSRVVKFDATGKQLAVWGTAGSGDLQFRLPHSVAVDDDDNIYVAERGNKRIQVLDAKGVLKKKWSNVGEPLTVRFRNGSIYVLSNLSAKAGIVRQFNTKGELLASFHTMPPNGEGSYEWPHGMAVSQDDSTVYIGHTLTGKRIQKFIRTTDKP